MEEQVKIEMIKEGRQRKSETRHHVVPERQSKVNTKIPKNWNLEMESEKPKTKSLLKTIYSRSQFMETKVS